MAEASSAMARGTYVEIRRGRQVVVGQIVWTRHGQFGLRSQDRIDLEAIVREPRLTRRPVPATNPNGHERRIGTRARHAGALSPAQKAERSRLVSKAAQFIVLACVGALSAAGVAGAVYSTLATPFTAVGAAMAAPVRVSAPQ